MCLAVFIATDTPLALLPVDPQVRVFSIGLLSSEKEPVRRLFSKAYLYSVMAHTGCGCGFRYAPEDLEILSYPDVPEGVKTRAKEDYEAGQESVRLLGAQIERAVTRGETVELYACLYGNFDKEPGTRRPISLADLDFVGESFDLVERQFFTVLK